MSMLEICDSFSPLTEFGHRIQQCVMPLITIVDGQLIPIGTGFTIAPDGLMMTAVHVIEEAMKNVVSKKNVDGTQECHIEFYALYLTNKTYGEKNEFTFGGLLPIQNCWYSPELDIGYCWPNSPIINDKPLRFPILPLSPGLPKVGENILGFGYHSMKGTISEEIKDGTTLINYNQNTAFTRGTIVEIFPIKRDRAMLPFPCFNTNARFDHGMSGGPILNEKGYVCGVICSSLPLIEDNPEYISHASLIWPALGTYIKISITEDAQPKILLVYDLIKKGFLSTDETISHLNIDIKPNGERVISILNTQHEMK